MDWDRIEEALAKRPGIYASLLGHHQQPARVQNRVHFAGKTIPSFMGNLKMLAEEIQHWRQAGNAVIILVGSYQRAQQLLSALRDEKVDAFYTGALEGHVRPGNVVITTGNLGAVLSCPAWW